MRPPAPGHRGDQEPVMFLRRYTRTKDGKAHTYYGLVESVRTAAGPRQQVSPTSANSTMIRNDAGNAPWSFTTGRAKTSN